MSLRFVLGSLALVTACHAAPPPRAPLSQRSPIRTPPPSVAVTEAPAWVPHRRRSIVTSTSITVLDDVRFLPGMAQIDPSTTPILDAFATTMQDNDALQLIEVRVFAADVDAEQAQSVADERARNIVDYVVAKGVSPDRLRPHGVPLPPAGTNARLQFEIVQRAP